MLFEEKNDKTETDMTNLIFNNKGLQLELKSVSTQLAQRAVLFAAQERRFIDNSRV